MMVTIAWAMIVCSMQTGGSVALHSLNFRYSVVCYNVLNLNLYWLLQACDNLSYKVTTIYDTDVHQNERKHILTNGRDNLHKNFLCSIKKCCILCSKTTITMISNFILLLMIGDKNFF